MTRTLTLSLLLAGVALAGCGKMGELEPPGATSAQAADAAADQDQSVQAPVNIKSEVNREDDPAPPRTLPIEGGPSNPGEVAPPGALPDPYANPQ